MNCPNCATHTLRAVLTKQGIQVDLCDSCQGVWLDDGELLLFSKTPHVIAQHIGKALEQRKPSKKLSPRTGEPMEQITYPGGVVIDYCPRSRGLWFDQGELKTLLKQEGSVRMEVDQKHSSPASADAMKTAPGPGDARRGVPARPGLLPLPSLFLRSAMTLVGLYALLGAVLIAAVEFGGVDLEWAVGLGIGILLLQFLLGPFFMDLSLKWMYQLSWVSPAELPPHLTKFVQKVCGDKGIEFPRFGVIDDGAPQAFTYGVTPNNARVVISRGILELLEPQEVEAVVAHELGHVVHWDMALMTVAQMVPLILYYIYRTFIRARGKNSGNAKLVAMVAYVLYIISEYVVLWFSRTREYHADRFSGEVTGSPSRLASALVKIAYGLAGQDTKPKESKEPEESKQRSPAFEAIGAMGIFDGNAARGLAVAGFSEAATLTGDVDPANLKGAMRWDLWNPWAKWYELNSTHPLVAKRLQYLSSQAAHMGQEPYIVFSEVQPESYWDEFFVDLAIYLLPSVALVLAAAYWLFSSGEVLPETLWRVLPVALAALGAAMMVKYRFMYVSNYFSKATVATLLKSVKVSAVRPVPCQLAGTIIGRGIPGYIFSEDFVMKDATGIMFLDYRQPLGIWELLFGLLKAGEYQGKDVVVTGWYRRSPVPYVQIDTLTCDGAKLQSWVPTLSKLSAFALLFGGIVWAVVVRL